MDDPPPALTRYQPANLGPPVLRPEDVATGAVGRWARMRVLGIAPSPRPSLHDWLCQHADSDERETLPSSMKKNFYMHLTRSGGLEQVRFRHKHFLHDDEEENKK